MGLVKIGQINYLSLGIIEKRTEKKREKYIKYTEKIKYILKTSQNQKITPVRDIKDIPQFVS